MPAVRDRHSAVEDAVLMHVDVLQDDTRMYEEQQRVSTAEQVREMDAACVSYHALLLTPVAVCIAEEDA